MPTRRQRRRKTGHEESVIVDIDTGRRFCNRVGAALLPRTERPMMRRRKSTLPAPPPRPTEVLATYKTLPEYRKWADLDIVGESFYQDNIARFLG